MDDYTPPPGFVYLLHLEQPLSPDHTAQHYIGYTDDLAARIQKHTTGSGSRFMFERR